MIKEENKLILEKGVDMSVPLFIEMMNKKFKKPSGKPFNAQDVQGFVKRGWLPLKYGKDIRITLEDHKAFGIKILSLIPLVK